MRYSLRVFLLLVLCLAFFGGTGYSQDDSTRQNQNAIPAEQTAPITGADTTVPKPVIKKTIPQPVVKDTLKIERQHPVTDSAIALQKDSVHIIADTGKAGVYGKFADSLIAVHPLYQYEEAPENLKTAPFSGVSKDELFYAICAMLLYIGILRLGFPKYFNDLFNVFWRSPVRHNQLRDQLQQAGLTNLLFNIFFVLSLALFAYLAVTYNKGRVMEPWLLFSVCFFAIAVLYIGKFAILKVCGWMFGKSDASDTYIFIVFLVNKILAILLLPLIVLLAFSTPGLQQISFTVAVSLIVLLFFYRFVLSFSGIRNDLKISGLHLFLYVCGFEIMPVLVIYRIMLHLFERSS